MAALPTGTAPAPTGGRVVDWALAERTAVRWSPRGPSATLDEARAAVAELAAGAAAATAHVAGVTGLAVPDGAAVRVVDRAGWVRANTASLRALLDPVLTEAVQRRTERARERRGGRPPGALEGRAVLAAGAALTGTEVGALLSWLSSRVLGQYDVFAPGGGQLLLVAPNVVEAERELGVDPRDFRLWVALHEETHRVQFAVAPWLGDHLAGRARSLSTDLLGGDDGDGPTERLLALVRQALPGRAGAGDGPGPGAGPAADGGSGLVGALAGPQQRRALAEVTAVMSLLEGHADVVMDDAGPAVVPSVARIRERFSQRRRRGRSAPDRVLRRLLGLEAKMRQYTDGARFVRRVVADVGHEGLNRVWEGPELLPRPEEIGAPGDWVRRVHG
jgi:coenzyme F420 biosynthesis associated uncharacterized protein